MNKILVISDVHGRLFWKEATAQYKDKCDKIVFLGDYVDPYPNEGITRKEAIKCLNDVIKFKQDNMDKTILLIGNHDAHYMYRDFTRSSRYDSSHAYSIREILLSHKSLFQLAYEETINNKKYLFTHAGLMNSWVERNQDIIGEPTVENLNKLANSKRGLKAISEVSPYRSWLGADSGSILWCDVREKIDETSKNNNIIPNKDSIVDGYDFQVFGHTQLTDKPIITDKWACVDCRKAFLINDNGEFIQY